MTDTPKTRPPRLPSVGTHRFETLPLSDWIVFFDESGDALLTPIDRQFPVLNLTAVAIRQVDYWDLVVPALAAFKHKHLGTASVVLHASSFRRKNGPFQRLAEPSAYADFMNALVNTLERLPFQVIAATIDKAALTRRYAKPHDPYALAMRFCMERLCRWLIQNGQSHRLTALVFESRGKRPDRQARAHCVGICQSATGLGRHAPAFGLTPFEPLFIPKRCNVAGLQLADLLAHPLARVHRHPATHEAAMAVIEPKLIAHKHFPAQRPYCAGNTLAKDPANSSHAPAYPDHSVRRIWPSASAHTWTSQG